MRFHFSRSKILPCMLGLNALCLGAVFFASASCTTVSQQEKARVLDKILREENQLEEEENQPVSAKNQEKGSEVSSQTGPTNESEVVAPAAQGNEANVASQADPADLTAAPGSETPPEPSPVAPPAVQNDPARKKTRPQMPQRQAVARLPFPRGVNHSDLLQFMNAHVDVLMPYQPILKEWNFYAKAFSEGASADEIELQLMKLRIYENFPRAHWLFVWGLLQTSFMLLDKSGSSTFLIDKQEDFLGRMSLLLFLATELDGASQRTEYRNVLKKFYINANAKYFKRPLTDRPAKPEGPLRPSGSPKDLESSEGGD